MTATPSEFDPRFDPAFQRGFDGEVVVPAAAARHQPVDEPAAADPAPLVMSYDGAPGLRGNPWVVALWIVAGALLAAGAVAQWFAVQPGASDGSGTSVFSAVILPGILAALAPWLVGGGLAAGIATMVLGASRWRSRD